MDGWKDNGVMYQMFGWGMNQAATSQHLGKMRAEGLVATRRAAQTIYYRMADPAAVQVVDLLCTLYGGEVKAG